MAKAKKAKAAKKAKTASTAKAKSSSSTRPAAARGARGGDENDGPRGKRTRVRALKMGYYDNQRRREGDVFDMGEEVLVDGRLPKWVVPVDGRARLKSTGPNEALKQHHDQVMRERSAQGTQGQEGADEIDDDGSNPLGDD